MARLVSAGTRLAQLKRVFYGVDTRDISEVDTAMLASALANNGFEEHAHRLQVRLLGCEWDLTDTHPCWANTLVAVRAHERQQ